MNKNNSSALIIPIMVALCIPILLFNSLFFFLNSKPVYEALYQKYRINDKISKDKLSNVTDSIQGYLKGESELEEGFFSKNEQAHLNDVKKLVQKAHTFHMTLIGVIVILVFYACATDKKRFQYVIERSCFGTFAAVTFIIILLAIMYFVTGFDLPFNKFHELFFTGNYAFDPNVSNMKYMFPDGFFMDMSFYTIIGFLIQGLLLYVFRCYLRKDDKNHDKIKSFP